MTVLKIAQETLIQLPAGSTGGAVKISYNGTTTGSVVASGDDAGRAVLVDGRLAKLTALDGKSPLQVVGREAGGRMPARCTLRIYPEGSGVASPIVLSGLPIGSPDVPGIWDLSNIDDASGGMDVVLPGERQRLALLMEGAGTARVAAETAAQSASTAEAKANTAIANLNATVEVAAAQAMQEVVADYQVVKTDIAHTTAENTNRTNQAVALAEQTQAETMKAGGGAVDPRFVSTTEDDPRVPTWDEFLADGGMASGPQWYYGMKKAPGGGAQLVRYEPRNGAATWLPVYEPAVAERMTTQSLPNVAALRAYTGTAQSIVIGGAGGGVYVADTAVYADDGYTKIKNSAVTHGWRRLDEVTLDTFKEAGDADYTGALDRAIAWANARGGNCTIRLPAKSYPGYVVTAPPRAIVANFVFIRGDGELATTILIRFTGRLFQWGVPGSVFTVGGGSNNIALAYDYDPNIERTTSALPANNHPTVKRAAAIPAKAGVIAANADQNLLFYFANCTQMHIDRVQLDACYRFMELGSADGQGNGQGIVATNILGYAKNAGVPLIRVHQGHGFHGHNINLFTDAPPPIAEQRYKNGVDASGGDEIYYQPMATLPGTSLVEFTGVGGWDTFKLDGPNLMERWYHLIHAKPKNGVLQNISIRNPTADFCRSDSVLIESEGGWCTQWTLDGYFVAWEGCGLYIKGTQGGGSWLQMKGEILLCGKEAVRFENPVWQDVDINATIWGTHSLSAANTGTAAVKFANGQKRFKVDGIINKDSARHGPIMSSRADFAVDVGNDSDDYQISGLLGGRVVGFRLPNNATPSRLRRVDAVIEGFEVIETEFLAANNCPASGTEWVNTTPFKVVVGAGGGAVNQIIKQGRLTGRTAGEFTLSPGQKIQLNYSVAPTFSAWLLS